MRILALLGILSFILTWQKLNFALLFLLPTFYALYKENFIILWARKNIIKKATLNKNALFYRLTKKHTYLGFISLFLAFFALLSLVLNLMYASLLDLAFLFVFFPLFFLLVKKMLHSQFRKNPYNTLRVVFVSALFTSFFYSFSQMLFRENFEPFFYLNNYLDMYKVSYFTPLDALSQALHFLVVFKNFMIFWLDSLPVKFLVFGFEFLNFFVLCGSFALLCSFVFKSKKSAFMWFILGVLSLLFYEESINLKSKYQEKISLYLQNIQNPLLEQNLSSLQVKNEELEKSISRLKELLDKNVFEMGIWWLSPEKDELKNTLQKALK